MVTVSSLLVLSLVYAYVWRTEINKAYDFPYEVAKGAQQGLSEGMSPDGVIGVVTGSEVWAALLWEVDMPQGEKDDIVYIKETAKTYETSSENLDRSKLKISEELIKKTQETGEAQTALRLPNGNRYAIQSFPYSYGDVRGVVMVGRLNKPNQNKIDSVRNIVIAVGAAIAVVAFVTLKPFKLPRLRA